LKAQSLETIKHMVAAGMGVTLVPRSERAAQRRCDCAKKATRQTDSYVRYLPVMDGDGGLPPTTPRGARHGDAAFTRYEAIAALRNAIYACASCLGVTRSVVSASKLGPCIWT